MIHCTERDWNFLTEVLVFFFNYTYTTVDVDQFVHYLILTYMLNVSTDCPLPLYCFSWYVVCVLIRIRSTHVTPALVFMVRARTMETGLSATVIQDGQEIRVASLRRSVEKIRAMMETASPCSMELQHASKCTWIKWINFLSCFFFVLFRRDFKKNHLYPSNVETKVPLWGSVRQKLYV